MKQIIAVCILSILINLVTGKISIAPQNNIAAFNEIVGDVLRNHSEFEAIAFSGNDEEIINSLSGLIPRIMLLTNTAEIYNEIFANKSIDLLIIIINSLDDLIDSNKIILWDFPVKVNTVFIFLKAGKTTVFTVRKLFYMFRSKINACRTYIFFGLNFNMNGIKIFTDNPYTDYAPLSWLKYTNIKVKNYEVKWIIYQRLCFTKNESNHERSGCENLIFDRAKHLNNHTIKVSRVFSNKSTTVTRSNEYINKDSDLDNILVPIEAFIAKAIMKYLNVSMVIVFGRSMDVKDDTKIHTSEPKLLAKNSMDLTLSPAQWVSQNLEVNVFNFLSLSYPIFYSDDVIITKNRGLLTPLEKMFDYYGWLIITSTFIILSITFVVIYFSNHRMEERLSFSIFECLRLLINNSLNTCMDSIKLRIVFFFIFLYFLVIQATFSGHLAAFLTKPEYRKNAETLEDLKDPRYETIYASLIAKEYITDPVLIGKTNFNNYWACENDIGSKPIACIGSLTFSKGMITKFNLQYSKNSLRHGFNSIAMTRNWVLGPRVNNLIIWLSQSGVIDKWLENYHEQENHNFKVMQDYLATDDYYRPVDFSDLTFAFILLAVGIFCSFICFIAELFIEIIKVYGDKIRQHLRAMIRPVVLLYRIASYGFRRLLESLYNPRQNN